jgi:hypothetical protein
MTEHLFIVRVIIQIPLVMPPLGEGNVCRLREFLLQFQAVASLTSQLVKLAQKLSAARHWCTPLT